LWRQILADVFARPVAILESQEGSAYGAALLALVGTREYKSVGEVCEATIRETESIGPGESAIYAEGHELYRSLYPALREIFVR
jgi:xylulokinase